MLIAILTEVGLGLLGLLIGALLGRRVSNSPFVIIGFQTLVAGILGFAAWKLVPSFGRSVFYVTAMLPIISTSISVANQYWYKRRALSGAYGKSTQWAAELVNNGDREFEQAAMALPDEERLELGVVAESKDELRELVIERHEQSGREPIPEDLIK